MGYTHTHKKIVKRKHLIRWISQIKNLCSSKDTVKKMKMYARYYEKISKENTYLKDGLNPEYFF